MNGSVLASSSSSSCPILFGGRCQTPGWTKPSFGYAPVYISIFSCSASCVGSVLIIAAYLLFRDIRTGLRKIVTYLAIADLITASGYLLGNANFIYYKGRVADDEMGACSVFDAVCQIQAYITSWSSLSSFAWTAVLAGYLYSVLVKGDSLTPSRHFASYHILSWGAPMVVMLPLLCAGKLGYSLFAAGGWCFINSGDVSASGAVTHDLSLEVIALILVGGKAVEVTTYIIVIAFYGSIQWNIKKKMAPNLVEVVKKAERKLAFIPVLFILLRIWGTLQFIFSIVVKESRLVDPTGCISTTTYYVYLIITCAQAFGDGGQGWANAILYILWSQKIRQRLLVLPARSCFMGIVNYVMVSSDSYSHCHANERTQLLVGEAQPHSSPTTPPGWAKKLEDEGAAFRPDSCSTPSPFGDMTAAKDCMQSEQLHVQCGMKVDNLSTHANYPE